MPKEAKEYYLMHKDIPVCLMEIDMNGQIFSVRRNKTTEDHFPLGGQMNDMKFHEWWNDRAIPKTRHGVKTALQKLGYTTTNNALVNNLALSLSDCYWILPRGEDICWKDVSLFTNDFVDTFGEITINEDHPVNLEHRTQFDCASSPGELQKKWCIDKDGRRYMVKGNYGDSFQQSINELFASKLHIQQGFSNFTAYYPADLEISGGYRGLGCISYDFCNENIECISAWELLQTRKIRQNESLFYPFKEACLTMGIREEEFTAFMDYEIMTDYLISNTDRHMNNIALVRDPDSLAFLGFAPIYDSGNSMFYHVPSDELRHINMDKIVTHSFIKYEKDLLKYVQNRNAVNPEKAIMDFQIYHLDVPERHARIPELKRLYERKLDRLYDFQAGRDIWKTSHFTV